MSVTSIYHVKLFIGLGQIIRVMKRLGTDADYSSISAFLEQVPLYLYVNFRLYFDHSTKDKSHLSSVRPNDGIKCGQFFRKFAQKKPFQFIKLKVTNIFENKPKSHHIF